MSKLLKLRRGTTAQHSTFTGASGEVTVDTDKKTLVVHDGTTAGGNPVLSAAAGAVGTASLASNSVTTAKLADNAVTYAKMQSVSAGKVLGRDTSGAGTVQELPIAYNSSTGNTAINGTPKMALGNRRSLEIGNAAAVSSLMYQAAVSETLHNMYFTSGGVPKYASAGYAGYVSFNNAEAGGWSWQTAPSGAADADATSATQMVLSNAGVLKFNSGYGSAAAAYGCRAWVNFNGTGTVAIHASGNVSSITDNGVGDYTVNFSTSMPDQWFGMSSSTTCIVGTYTRTMARRLNEAQSAAYVRVYTAEGAYDVDHAMVAIHR